LRMVLAWADGAAPIPSHVVGAHQTFANFIWAPRRG
jgi:hypothetical protein